MSAEKKEEMTLEESFDLLEKLIKEMESGKLTLEETFGRYQKGMNLLKTCSDKIDLVEKMVLKMDEDGELHEF